MKIFNCYVFLILNYGCEYWTRNIAMCKKIYAFEAFEQWCYYYCYRRMLKISWKDKVTNVEVLKADEGRFALNEEHKKEEA